MNYTSHLNTWLDFLKQKIESAKRLYSNSSPENYNNRRRKIEIRREILELENNSLAELLPYFQEISRLFSDLRVSHMKSGSSDQGIMEIETSYFKTLPQDIRTKLNNYLNTLENLLAEQEGLSGRQSTKKSLIPQLNLMDSVKTSIEASA